MRKHFSSSSIRILDVPPVKPQNTQESDDHT
jgi:hypothetical protein